jgi:hypothetical protein
VRLISVFFSKMWQQLTLAACAILASSPVDAKKIFWVPFPGSVSHHMLAAKVRTANTSCMCCSPSPPHQSHP